MVPGQELGRPWSEQWFWTDRRTVVGWYHAQWELSCAVRVDPVGNWRLFRWWINEGIRLLPQPSRVETVDRHNGCRPMVTPCHPCVLGPARDQPVHLPAGQYKPPMDQKLPSWKLTNRPSQLAIPIGSWSSNPYLLVSRSAAVHYSFFVDDPSFTISSINNDQRLSTITRHDQPSSRFSNILKHSLTIS